MSDQNIVDLSALQPDSVKLKLPDGTVVDVQPIKIGLSVRLGSLGQKLQKADSLGDDELDALLEQVSQLIVKVIPELKDISLNTAQLLAVIQMVSEMAAPASQKALDNAGVELDTSPKA